ncbi:MAG: hypothetical protein AB8G86_30300 [Saprospiraceae bacterium]
MKKLFYGLLGGLLCLTVISLFLVRYLNGGSVTPDNTVWQSYIGRDTTVGILPDRYANYFTYTVARTNDDIGFKIKGVFPSTRYFSFNVYSLGDNATQGSLVDYQIKTDSGKPNPFLGNKDSVATDNNFTVYIVPSKHTDKKLPNLLPFRDDSRLLTMVIRLYDYNIDDFGGVEFPTVEAFEMEDAVEDITLTPVNLPRALNLRTIVRNVSLPGMVERLGGVFLTEKTGQLDGPTNQKHIKVPFHAIDTKGYIENNDNRYLLAGITKKENEVFVFKFKSPTYTTGPADINQTNVRYWSFNLGNAATYNFNGLKDEEIILDEQGYANIVLASKDAALQARTAALGYNFLEWNMPWEKGLILFRHMLADPNFEAQIDKVPPINDDMTDFTSIEGQKFMGDYAPQGMRMSKTDFLAEYSIQVEQIEANQED